MIKIVEGRLGVPDYYGLYIEPENDDGFLVYDRNRNTVERIVNEVRRRWRFIKNNSSDDIKNYILDEVITTPNYIKFLDDPDLESFDDSNITYWLNGKTNIWILKSFY